MDRNIAVNIVRNRVTKPRLQEALATNGDIEFRDKSYYFSIRAVLHSMFYLKVSKNKTSHRRRVFLLNLSDIFPDD